MRVDSLLISSSATPQHGGQESTILTFHPLLLHLGMIVVGLPYAFQGQTGVTEDGQFTLRRIDHFSKARAACSKKTVAKQTSPA